VFNTISQAEPDEVLYVADTAPVETWDGIGRTAPTVTRTTIYPLTSTFPVIALGQTQAISFITNPSLGFSISWRATTTTSSIASAADISALPHTSTTIEEIQTVTTQSSALLTLAAIIIPHGGDTFTIREDYPIVTTVSKYIGSLEFESTFSYRSLTTRTRCYSGAYTTGQTTFQSASSESGSTLSVGGQQLRSVTEAAKMGIQLRAGQAQWSVFGLVGALGQDAPGLSYTFTDDISFVSQAKGQRRLFGPVTIFPATNSSYTANRTGLTWKTEGSTTSGAIEPDGEPRTELLFLNNRSGLLGGALADSETAVQRVPRGLYRDAEGQTTFFEGHDTSYTDSTIENTYYAARRFQEVGPFPVRADQRNSAFLPDFVSAQGDIYNPQNEEDEE